MKLANFQWNMVVPWPEDCVPVVVIENPVDFRFHVQELITQSEGSNGGFVLSKAFQPIDFQKNCAVIPEPLTNEINDRSMQAALTKWLKQEALCARFYTRTQELQSEILKWMSEITMESEEGLCFSDDLDTAQLIKLCSVRFDGENSPLPEKLLRKMRIEQSFGKRNCFIFVNLHSYLSAAELETLYREAFYRQLRIMVFENRCPLEHSETETRWILDRDHCEIYPDML